MTTEPVLERDWRNGHLTYHLVVPQECEVIVEYRNELWVIPIKEAEE